MADSGYEIADLLRVMERLRDPETGCPWDLRQDFHSIVPSTLEECYELAQAIEHEDFPHVAEELGDVLFQVVFYAQMGREQGLRCEIEELVQRGQIVVHVALGGIDDDGAKTGHHVPGDEGAVGLVQKAEMAASVPGCVDHTDRKRGTPGQHHPLAP